MRHQHMRRITAGNARRAAELARLDAIIFLVAQARRAIAAADPGIGRIAVADFHALHVGADGHDFAFDLVAQRVRQFQIAHRQLVAAAQIEIAVMDVDVGMADAGMRRLEEDFRALRRGRRRLEFLERASEFHNGLAEHPTSPLGF